MYKFKEGSRHTVDHFMQNNKELHLRNLKLRRTGRYMDDEKKFLMIEYMKLFAF